MEADDERPTVAAPSIGSSASNLETSPAQATGPAESSPALPSVIPSPVVHSPPDTAQSGGSESQQTPTLAISSGPEREESVDASIGAEEEEAEAVHRSFVGTTRRRRPREGRANSDGSGSSNAAEDAGPFSSSSSSSQSVVGMGAMRLPVNPVGAASSPKPPSPLTIVLVGGFLLPPSDEFHRLYWGEALAGFPEHRILCVHPGPIASLHDRVCQIFYELKGGRVKYGKGHAARFGHEPEGETFHPGSFPEWDADHPVHLIGHSFGGLTIRLLLHYLEKRAFEGHETSPDWVRSVTTINAPHNGTHLVYGLGADPSHPPVVHWGSPGHVLGTMAHLVEFADSPLLRRAGIDFGLSYFRLSRRHGLLAGLSRVVKALLGLSNVCSTPDNAAYDMTVHAALRINKVTTTYPGLFYFSFVGTCPRHRSPPAQGAQQGPGCSDSSSSPFTPPTTTIDEEQPQSQWLTALVKGLAYRLMAWHVSGVKFEGDGNGQQGGQGVFAALGPEVNGAARRWAEDGASDGVVSVFSQAFPRVPHEEPHHPAGLPEDYHDLVSGRWYVTELPVDHMGVIGYPHSRAWQSNFFEALYALLAHCHGRVWEGAMTPCTPHTHPTLSASSSSISPTTATEQPQPRTPGGGDFTWAALSTTPRNPATPPESPAAVPLHRQATLTQQPSRREIRRLERRGSWVLARQRSVCQCAGPQEGAGGGGNGAVPAASAASPSTRMYLCEECNGAVVTSPGAGAQEGHTQQAHGQEGEGKGAGRTQGPRLLLVLLAAAAGAAAIGLLLLPHTHNATPTCLLGWTLLWALTQHIFLPSLLPPPAHIPATHLWGQALTGVTQAVLASLAAVGLLLLPLPLRPETAAWARQQLRLASCGYYCLALASSSASVAIAGKQERHLHVSRAWQALLLALHVGLLLLQSEWGGQQLRGHQQRSSLGAFSLLLGLAELPNGLVLIRDLLVLQHNHHHGHQHQTKQRADRDGRADHPPHAVLASTPRPRLNSSSNTSSSSSHRMAGTRVAAAVWVSIWAAFFLCQLFPLAYLLMLALVASRALFVSSSAASAWGAAAVGVVWVVGIGVVGRMKALSERFQLDFSKTHVDHVRRGHAHACPSALLER